MTNEVTTCVENNGLIDNLANEIADEVSNVGGLFDDFVQWITVQGIGFAVDVVVALIMLAVGFIVIKLISAAVAKAAMRGGKSRTLFAQFIKSVTVKIGWAILLVMILGRLGVNVTPLIAGLGVTGFILGFAFQESLGNLASGMMIAINEPFKVGDFVSVCGNEGTIIEVNMMATVMRTSDNKKIVIPNKSVWGGPIVNYNALGTRRVELRVGVAYGTDLQRARQIILDTVMKVNGVLAEPAPTVGTISLDESAVTFVVRPWVQSADYWQVHFDVNAAIESALTSAGISIPFPQLEVSLRK